MAEAREWYVLQHRPGPSLAQGQTVFEHPGFAEHVAFLQRRMAAGELVAAGPLADTPGDGMTVLAVDSIEEATRLATLDDQAVVTGVLLVDVRPWRVLMAR